MQSTSFGTEQRTSVESFVTEWMSDNNVPGAAVAVTDGERLVYSDGFGARSLAERQPVTPETLFGVGSCTKSITAMAIMQLAECGALSVTDPVEDYLQYLSGAPGEPITVRELLTHTSGLPSAGLASSQFVQPLLGGQVTATIADDDDFRRHLEGACEERVTERDAFMYCNAGYALLGKVVEAAAGQPFEEYVREEIFDRLSMERSTFSREAFEADLNRMTPYLNRDGETSTARLPFDEFTKPAGGLVSSVAELADYVCAYLGAGAFDDEELLKPASVEEMATTASTYGTYVDGREIGYGYGLMVEELQDWTVVGHGGLVGVSSAWFGFVQEAALGVVVACSTEPAVGAPAVGKAILAVLRGERPGAVVPELRFRDALASVTGSYEAYRGHESATVKRVEGALRLERSYGPATREFLVFPEELDDGILVCSTRTETGLRHPVRFEFDGDGVDLFVERVRYSKVD